LGIVDARIGSLTGGGHAVGQLVMLVREAAKPRRDGSVHVQGRLRENKPVWNASAGILERARRLVEGLDTPSVHLNVH
jgi:hypothetical protein